MKSQKIKSIKDKKILVVEDDAVTRNLLHNFFVDSGYIVEVAEDRKTCLSVQEKFNPDIITLDLILPDVKGYNLACELREKNPYLIIIMLTGHEDESNKIKSLSLGANDYLTKPFSLDELKARIENFLNFRDALELKTQRSTIANFMLDYKQPEVVADREKCITSKNKNILIVEDDFINAHVFSKILTKRGGYHVQHTEDTDEVLILAESGTIDIILMDVSLSRTTYRGKSIDGIKITQMLKFNPKTASIPVILVTAHAMEGDRENFLIQSGADDYEPKPIMDHQDFVNLVDLHLYADPLEKLKKYQERYARSQAFYSEKISNLESALKEAKNRIEDLEKKLERHIESENTGELNSIVLAEQESSSVDIPIQQSSNHQTNELYQIICADVAHSLRGEIMNIGGFNQEIRDLCNNSPEVLGECELIERSLQYSQIRLQRLMDYLSLGKPQMKTIDIDKLIGEVESLSRPRLPSSINMEVQIQEGLKGKTILGNSDQLKSVLVELINNSTKALQRSTRILHKSDRVIQIIAGYEDGIIIISVKDNGSGISEDLTERLFKGVVTSDMGSGMGLYISNKIIHKMGGNLKLESSDQGTTITLEFAES